MSFLYFSHTFLPWFDEFPFAAMSFELHLKTLDGRVITIDVLPTSTVKELKNMLLEKHPCEDRIERKFLKVELLREGSLLDDSPTLREVGLLNDSDVMVMYTRNEVEASTLQEIQIKGFFHVIIPLHPGGNFSLCF